MSNNVSTNCTIEEFQSFIRNVYETPDDRLFSLSNLLSNQGRFTMRALKGIRKKDKNKLILNLMLSFSWLMAVANRLHIDVEPALWNRFPYLCSYCGKKPCVCKKIKTIKRINVVGDNSLKPKTIKEYQKMFSQIYPPKGRSLPDSGVHLAEETGEVSEIIHFFMGEHRPAQFHEITDEIADWVSCMYGVANSGEIDVLKELSKMYHNNCHICHKAPCTCKFTYVAKFKS